MVNPNDELTRRVDSFIEKGLAGRTRSAAEESSLEFVPRSRGNSEELREYGTPYRLHKEGGRYVTIKVDELY
ncbi:MAG: hypothetical protein WCV90_03540 [Candidatus Woesearchaeota archaeon]